MPPRIVSAEELLAATITIIDRDGEAAVRVREVCEACGITAPVLYTHFENRDALIVAAQAKRYNDARLAFLDIFRKLFADVDNRDSFVSTMVSFLPLHLDAARSAHRALRTSVLGSVIGRPELAAAIGEADRLYTAAIREVLGEAQQRGWIRPDIEVGALGLWWVSVVDGRFHLEQFDAGVDPGAWDHVALTAARFMLFGD
jgi:AcrR family transcriptional regulator